MTINQAIDQAIHDYYADCEKPGTEITDPVHQHKIYVNVMARAIELLKYTKAEDMKKVLNMYNPWGIHREWIRYRKQPNV